jgi:carbamoyltransferase
MKVIGISGLENSVPFRKAHWPSLDPREYHIARGLDAGAVLIVNGKLVAAAEQERFNGKKHTGDFPIDAIEYCLAQAGVSIHEIDEIAHDLDFAPYHERYAGDTLSSELYEKVLSRDALLKQMKRELPSFPLQNVHQISHHLAHAAGAAFTSGWDECLVVVNDAMGELESASVYSFRNGNLEKVHTSGVAVSIGLLYSLVALHLGFDFSADDHQLLDLAPPGDPARFRKFFQDAVQLCPDGSICIPILNLEQTTGEQDNFAAARADLDQHLIPRRAPGEPIGADHHDVAAALQECLERAMLHTCENFAKITGHRRLALAGSAALNAVASNKLSRSPLFDEIYVQPMAGSGGAALGAALYRSSLAMKIPNERLPVPFFGPRYSAGEIESALFRCNGRVRYQRYKSFEETCSAAAKLIAEGQVVAWSRGRMEYGPQALGNRSILADPAQPQMRDRVNAMLRKQEASSPFAAACTTEEAHRWFEIVPGAELPYRTGIVSVCPESRAQLPAITRVDGSALLQTVGAKDNADFHALLVAVGLATGRQMLLNANFSLDGQPIVNTPQDAIVAFLGSGIEHLFLENFHVTRSTK